MRVNVPASDDNNAMQQLLNAASLDGQQRQETAPVATDTSSTANATATTIATPVNDINITVVNDANKDDMIDEQGESQTKPETPHDNDNDEEEEDATLYCACQRLWEAKEAMVGCDICTEW